MDHSQDGLVSKAEINESQCWNFSKEEEDN